ncbi:MAG: hypothetical protein IBX68_08830 [Dehalococcoidia bacterium]|nr:hypothetical protein [Dehalococcoidia bacterium]
MTGELVPELHDIGKLVDNNSVSQEIPDFLGAKHWFKDIDLASINLPQPESLTWLGVVGHHLLKDLSQLPEQLKPYPYESLSSLALLQLADHFASSTSRVLEKKFEEKIGVDKTDWASLNTDCVQTIWKYEQEEITGLPVRTKADLRTLLEFIQTDPNYINLLEHLQYGKALACVPEEKGFPRNITSLRTHLDLTGKSYRILNSVVTKKAPSKLVYLKQEATSAGKAEKTWRFRLARCRVTFPQHLSRVHDFGVFLRLRELMQEIAKDDRVLMHTLDSLWLLLPVEEISPLSSVLKPFLDAGFIIEVKVAEEVLENIDSKILDQGKSEIGNLYLYPDTPSSFSPPICELCQMRPASPEPEIDEKSAITEHLCKVCTEFRRLSEERARFTRLGGEWEESGTTIAWVRIHLAYEKLPRALKDLFKTYIRETSETITEGETQVLADNLRDIALMVDFTKDYHNLLAAFSRHIINEMEVEEIGGEHPELLAIAVKAKGQTLQIADTFVEEFGQIFPRCEDDSPISLSISVSNAKYPFIEHRRFLDRPGDAINIQAVGRACLELSISRFRRLREIEPEQASSKLHRAVTVGVRTRSKLMEEIEFLEDLQRHQQLHRAHIQECFSVEQLLNYYRIMMIGGSHESLGI